MAVININNCLFKISDKNGAHDITIKIGEGNLTYGERKPRTYVKDRGNLDTVRNADAEVMTVSFGFTWDYITSKTSESVPTVEEALKQEGNASDWQSASDDDCEPYAVDIRIENDPNCGTTGGEIIALPDFRYESLDHDVRAGTVACAGNCNVEDAVKSRILTDPEAVSVLTLTDEVALGSAKAAWTDPVVTTDVDRIVAVLSETDEGSAPTLPIATGTQTIVEIAIGVEEYIFTGLTAGDYYVSVWSVDTVGRHSLITSDGPETVT